MKITTSVCGRAMVPTALAVVAFAGSTQAITLTDGNASIGLDPASPAGVYEWNVDSQNHLFRQWFWYRVGDLGQGDRERSIDTLSTATIATVGSKQATVSYSGTLFDISVTYTLAGGTPGSGQSTLNEDITIVNKTPALLDLQFFQYSDFDLGGDGGGDSVFLYPSSSPFALAYQWDDDFVLQESVDSLVTLSPRAGLGAVGFQPTIYNLLENDNLPTDLNTSVTPIGPGDVEFAFQWDLAIAGGGSVIISKVKDISVTPIPEPTITMLAVFGIGAILLRRSSAS